MSAICGVVNFDGAPADAALLRRMTEAAPWRGPDGVHHWVKGNVGLAHQAFHVTPESVRERQPLVSADGRLALVADGRIDNREELIRALTGEGLPPDPTDADLLLAAYRRWREACAERLLGDFVFAVWDNVEQQLFLARDAMGGRSLCYQVDGRRCLFASEVGQILEVPGFQVRINEDKIADYLARLNQEHAETLFESVYFCPPAHVVIVAMGRLRQRRYWDVDPAARVRYRDDREYAEHFLALLTAATRCRLRAIGPVGLSLSGGLDSTLLAAVATKLLPGAGLGQARLKSFSYVFDELKSCDEREYVRLVVEHLGLDATYLPGDDKWALKNLCQWPVERDYIWTDAYAWLMAAVAEAARDAGCRVLLNGQFGDVLFLGGSYWAADLLRDGRWKELIEALRDHGHELHWRSDLVEHGLRQLIPSRIKQALSRLKPRPVLHRHPAFHPAMADRVKRRARAAADVRSQRFSAPGQWVRLTALTDSSWAEDFGEGRRYYNRYHLEAESPYNDRRLTEYVMALPADQLGCPWRNRWIQRNAMAGLLPAVVRERKDKTDFEVLTARGLFERETAAVGSILTGAHCVRRHLVRSGWLEGARLDKALSSEDVYQLWRIISLELWLRQMSNVA